MLKRSLKLTKEYSLFLFGARGVGKSALEFGMLPRIFGFNSKDAKCKFLQAYTLTYLTDFYPSQQTDNPRQSPSLGSVFFSTEPKSLIY